MKTRETRFPTRPANTAARDSAPDLAAAYSVKLDFPSALTLARALALAMSMVLGALLIFAANASAQPYDLSWRTIDGGGKTFSTGGAFSLGGTIGQTDAGTLVGGAFVLAGGFWKGGVTAAATSVDEPLPPWPGAIPIAFRLYPNTPNPFNPMTTVRYDLPRASEVRLKVYDVSGALVRELVSGARPAGQHIEAWDGTNGEGQSVASGVYFLRIDTGQDDATRKMILAK